MIVRPTHNVSLAPRLDAFVDAQVISGQDRPAGEALRAPLRRSQARK
jgi:Arc/MetJ-type ribon-helix-helix transcriptional regulator